MADIIKGGVLINETARILNDICISDGGIEENDARIWDEWMHLLNNEDWLDLLAAMEGLEQDSPGIFYPADSRVFNQARKDLQVSINKNKDFVGRRLVAKSGNKNTAWQTVMRVREVLNRYRGEVIPNRPPSIYGHKPQPKTVFDQVFECPVS